MMQEKNGNVRLNFKGLQVYSGVAHKESYTVDIRELFADLIYAEVRGVAAKSLALKIYESDELTEYTDSEVEIITQCAEALCTPKFCDAILEMIEKAKTDNQ